MIAELLLRAATPSPTPTPGFDPNAVTPGVIGFIAIFVVALLVVLLILDMVRRVRRVNYRAQVNEQLDAEERERGDRDGGDDTERPDNPQT
ncbi:hypothetical protein [Paramicrobacterium fandaimingii]|uniref:hypothetical protein n=1 Tax=Paramicrobacterium fandaimingii TaxID=2708079 RepID=UPI0014230C65|nr:hypothetical protein [Microbacterium fandaimingii]